MAAQVYGIQQYPVVEGTVGGLARLAQMIYERQDALEDRRDRKTMAERELGLKEQQLAVQRDYQQRSLDQNDPIAMQRKAYQIINDPNSTQGEIAAAQNMYGTLTYMMDPTRKVERDQQMKGLWSQMLGTAPVFGRTPASPLAGLGNGIGVLPYDEQPLPPGLG